MYTCVGNDKGWPLFSSLSGRSIASRAASAGSNWWFPSLSQSEASISRGGPIRAGPSNWWLGHPAFHQPQWNRPRPEALLHNRWQQQIIIMTNADSCNDIYRYFPEKSLLYIFFQCPSRLCLLTLPCLYQRRRRMILSWGRDIWHLTSWHVPVGEVTSSLLACNPNSEVRYQNWFRWESE